MFWPVAIVSTDCCRTRPADRWLCGTPKENSATIRAAFNGPVAFVCDTPHARAGCWAGVDRACSEACEAASMRRFDTLYDGAKRACAGLLSYAFFKSRETGGAIQMKCPLPLQSGQVAP